MSLIVPDQGEVLLLQYMLGKASVGTVKVHLYTNSPTLGESTVYADFVEAAVAGYAEATLVNATWGTPSGTPTTITYGSSITFTTSAAVTVNGYYVTTNDGGNKVLWAEAFPAAFSLPIGGGNIVITLKMEMN